MRRYAYKRLNETNITKVLGKIFTAYPNTMITRTALLAMTLVRFEARMVLDNGYWTSSETVGKVLDQQVREGKVETKSGPGGGYRKKQ